LQVQFRGQQRHIICNDSKALAYLNAACSPANGTKGGGVEYEAEFTFSDGSIIRAAVSISELHSLAISRPGDEGWFEDRYYFGVSLPDPQPPAATKVLNALINPDVRGETRF
jgi:hypothetical protein